MFTPSLHSRSTKAHGDDVRLCTVGVQCACQRSAMPRVASVCACVVCCHSAMVPVLRLRCIEPAPAWAPSRDGEHRRVMPTRGQPFVLPPWCRGLLQYRTVSLTHVFAIGGGQGERAWEERGLPRRLYFYGLLSICTFTGLKLCTT